MEKENNANVCQNVTTYCTESTPRYITYKVVDYDGTSHWDENGKIDHMGGIIKVVFGYTATTVNEDCTSSSTVGIYEDVIHVPAILCENEKEAETITYGRPKYNDIGIDVYCYYEDTKIVGDTSFVLPCEGGTVSVPFEYMNDKICMRSLTVKEDEFPDFIKEVNIDTANTVINITVKKNTDSYEKGGSILIYNNGKYLETISIIVGTSEKCLKKTKSSKSQEQIMLGQEIPTPDDKEYMPFNGEIEFKTPTEGCSNIVSYVGFRLFKKCYANGINVEEVEGNTEEENKEDNKVENNEK